MKFDAKSYNFSLSYFLEQEMKHQFFFLKIKITYEYVNNFHLLFLTDPHKATR